MSNKDKAQDFLDSFKGHDGVGGQPFSEQMELNLLAGITELLGGDIPVVNEDILSLTEPCYDIEDDKEARAEKKGLEIVYPKKNQIQIDIDNDEDWERLCLQLSNFELVIQGTMSFTSITESVSGGGHRHATITLPWEIKSEWGRVALQFALCSDFKRECLGAFRLAAGLENVTCFFEKPPEAKG